MNNATSTPLSVSFRDLPRLDVACADCQVNMAAGTFSHVIVECFESVKAWARQQGYDTETLLLIGIPQVVNGQLESYQCCIQLPEAVPTTLDSIKTQSLAGGKYAVLTIEKESEVIGRAMGQFFQEYVPQHRLEIDGTRPSYEVYFEHILEYHVPIV